MPKGNFADKPRHLGRGGLAKIGAMTSQAERFIQFSGLRVASLQINHGLATKGRSDG